MAESPEKVRSRKAVGLCDPNAVFFSGPCKGDLSDVKKHCDVTKKENKSFRERREDRNKKIARRNRKPKTKNKSKLVWVRNKTWKDEHCKSTLFQINRDSLAASMDKIKNGAEEMQKYLLEKLEELPLKAAEKVAKKKVAAMGARGACGALVFPPAIAVCVAAVTAADLIDSAMDAAELADDLLHMKDRLEELKRLGREAQEAAKAFNKDGSINQEELEKFQKKKIKEMTDAVTKNPCLKARRCFLTPYRNTGKQGSYRPVNPPRGKQRTMMDRLGSKTHSLADPRGCCPGMTGHHLVPNAWMDDEAGGTNCPNYNHNNAPVVCVVGADHGTGEHGTIHSASDELLEKHMLKNGCRFTLDDAIGIGTQALKRTVGSDCDPKCIKEQLENHYKTGGPKGIGCKGSTPMTPYHIQKKRNIKGICDGQA
jgi:hypothetical protein